VHICQRLQGYWGSLLSPRREATSKGESYTNVQGSGWEQSADFFSFSETESHCASQPGLELAILLLPPHKC
jgi:hypothetical protein